ncbi:hypothetical protein HAZT_HAZT006529 [Hyalella azteca]|uniref:Uncharacterized protein n=1 Tax=Hyalella azteca TaxID=294128 RepID=A0A6A0H2A7_HYAAZ|nr:hypothetical protein HAZT_HAZT006529 [Hyalella azteca]
MRSPSGPCGDKASGPCGDKGIVPCGAKSSGPCGAKTSGPCEDKTSGPCGDKGSGPCGTKSPTAGPSAADDAGRSLQNGRTNENTKALGPAKEQRPSRDGENMGKNTRSKSRGSSPYSRNVDKSSPGFRSKDSLANSTCRDEKQSKKVLHEVNRNQSDDAKSKHAALSSKQENRSTGCGLGSRRRRARDVEWDMFQNAVVPDYLVDSVSEYNSDREEGSTPNAKSFKAVETLECVFRGPHYGFLRVRPRITSDVDLCNPWTIELLLAGCCCVLCSEQKAVSQHTEADDGRFEAGNFEDRLPSLAVRNTDSVRPNCGTTADSAEGRVGEDGFQEGRGE